MFASSVAKTLFGQLFWRASDSSSNDELSVPLTASLFVVFFRSCSYSIRSYLSVACLVIIPWETYEIRWNTCNMVANTFNILLLWYCVTGHYLEILLFNSSCKSSSMGCKCAISLVVSATNFREIAATCAFPSCSTSLVYTTTVCILISYLEPPKCTS